MATGRREETATRRKKGGPATKKTKAKGEAEGAEGEGEAEARAKNGQRSQAKARKVAKQKPRLRRAAGC